MLLSRHPWLCIFLQERKSWLCISLQENLTVYTEGTTLKVMGKSKSTIVTMTLDEVKKLHPDFYKPTKTEVHIRIDTDVLEWFKRQGKGYQTKINAVLRAHAFG